MLVADEHGSSVAVAGRPLVLAAEVTSPEVIAVKAETTVLRSVPVLPAVVVAVVP